MSIYLIEVSAFNPTSNEVLNLKFSSSPIKPFSDNSSRDNLIYLPRIEDIGNHQRSMFGKGKTSGGSSSSRGSLVLQNNDGELDYLQDLAFSGRELILYRGEEGYLFSEYSIILRSIISQPVFSYDSGSPSTVTFSIVDKSELLNKPIQNNLYSGSNIGLSGNEGLETDIKNNKKPLCFGRCFNVSPIMCNSSALRYQVHDGEIIDVVSVYDKGVSLTKVTGTPSGGEFSVSKTTGIFTLGASPAGTVTADVIGAVDLDGVLKSNVAGIIKLILIEYSNLNITDIDLDSFIVLLSENSSEVGIFIDSDKTIKDILSELTGSIGAFWAFNSLGLFETGVLSLPSNPTQYFNEKNILSIVKNMSSDPQGDVPVWRVTLGYYKNYTVQTKDTLAFSVSDSDSQFLSLEYRTFSVDNTNVKDVYLLSGEIKRDTLLSSSYDIDVEANKLLNIYEKKREFYTIIIHESELTKVIDLNDCINFSSFRFGLTNGKDFRVLGVTRNAPDIDKIKLEVWG